MGDEFWYITVDLNDLEESLDIPKSEVCATVVRATGVLLDQLKKIWSTDFETAEGTIEVTTVYLMHEGSDHLSRRYSTNDKMLRFEI